MKIDKNLIENFDELSAEDKVKALLDFEFDNNSDEIAKLKAALNKSASETSNFKKQLREKEEAERAKMSAEEKEKADREAADKAKDELIAQLQREKAESAYTAKLIGLGVSEAEAKKAVAALPNEIGDDFFDVLSNFKGEVERKVKADVTKGTPRPDGGGHEQTETTKEQFAKMGYKERLELKQNNPEEYENLRGGVDDA